MLKRIIYYYLKLITLPSDYYLILKFQKLTSYKSKWVK